VLADPLLLLATLCTCTLVSRWLVQTTALRHAGTAMVVIVVTALIANLGLVPTGSNEAQPVPVYDAIFEHVAPLAIFWLVLQVDLRRALAAGAPLLALFLIGALGTATGVLVALRVLDPAVFGEHTPAMAGMFAATYIGGSTNFNTIALHYDLVREGILYVAAIAVDAGLTAVWMVVTIAVPRILRPTMAARPVRETPDDDPEREPIDPGGLGLLVALGTGSWWACRELAALLDSWGVPVPAMLLLTLVALLLAQIPMVGRLRGIGPLGMFAVYLFLAVIGAHCDVAAVAQLGAVGLRLLTFVTVVLAIHGVITFGAARLLGMDPDAAAIASQANVGGGATALALARGLGRSDLVLPAVLVGSVGTALGTFVGFAIAELLT
jgi:uncharacterized membrane protein